MTVKKNTKLDIALTLAAMGFKIFPIREGTKNKPRVRWARGGSKERATDDPAIIREWWTKWPQANIGIATGPSNLVVLDIDMKDERNGEEAFALLELLYESLPETRQVRTASGGRHLFFYRSVPIKNQVNFNSRMIGEGIDLRGDGGMVVAPGSETEKGIYTWINPEHPIAQAPEWLVELCTSNEGGGQGVDLRLNRTSDAQPLDPIVPLDEELAIARTIDFLKSHPPAIQGEGGDLHTYRTICQVKDFGISESKCLELLVKYWNDGCEPPWEVRDLKKKVSSAYRYGTEPPGVLSPMADFDKVEDGDEQSEKHPSIPPRFLTTLLLKHLPSLSWLIGGLIPESSFGMLVGEPGTFKSFFALHAALCVANGRACFGRPVRQGDTFYLAGESAFGYRLRTMAWEQHIGYSVSQPPFYLQVGGSHLNQGGEVRKLAEDILTLSRNPKLIIIDTVQVYLSGNENSPDDMGSFVKACLSLRDLTGAAVLVIHHLGKDVSKGARGHTSLIGAADFIFKTVKKESSIEVVCQKMKEADDRTRMFLEPHVVTVDPGGEFPDSLILREVQRPMDDETTSILRQAKEYDGRGQGVFVKSVEEDLNIRDAYRKVKKMIPEGKHNAIDFEDGSLWIEPDPDNPQGVKTIRYERDFAETDADISDLLA